jgi:hypothetical protein
MRERRTQGSRGCGRRKGKGKGLMGMGRKEGRLSLLSPLPLSLLLSLHSPRVLQAYLCLPLDPPGPGLPQGKRRMGRERERGSGRGRRGGERG